jgi:hypothetical protein
MQDAQAFLSQPGVAVPASASSCIQSTPSGNMPAFYSIQTLSGMASVNANSFFIDSDNADAAGGLSYWNFAARFGGSSLKGARNG